MKAARNAFPSASFGYMHATTLLFGIRFHIGTKHPWNSLSPKKNSVQYWNVLVGWTGFPPSPAYQDSPGQTVDTHGTPCDCATAATGFVVSGVEVVRIMSTWLFSTSSRATCEARFGSDWLSAVT